MLFRNKKHVVVEESERDSDKVKMHISETGRVWVDPKDVASSETFKRQLDAVKRLRKAQEQAAASV